MTFDYFIIKPLKPTPTVHQKQKKEEKLNQYIFDDKFHSPYTNRLERGYEICFQMYEKCHTLAGFNDQY